MLKQECHPAAHLTVPTKVITAQINVCISPFSRHVLICYYATDFERWTYMEEKADREAHSYAMLQSIGFIELFVSEPWNGKTELGVGADK